MAERDSASPCGLKMPPLADSRLHAGLARHRAHEDGDIGVTERGVGVVGADDVGEQRERAVVELHADAFEGAEGRGDLEQLQRDGCVRAEHRARCDTEEDAVADLASSTGDGNTNRSGHVPSVRLLLGHAQAAKGPTTA